MLLFCSFSLVFQWRSGKNFLPMFTKFGRILSYHEDLPPVKSHDSLIKWSSEITWQLKIKFLLPQCLWSRRLAEWWLVLRGSCLLRSLDKLKTLHIPKGLWAPNLSGHVTKYNPYISTTTAHDHQTWQDAELHGATPTDKVTWPVGRAFEWSRDKLKPLHFF